MIMCQIESFSFLCGGRLALHLALPVLPLILELVAVDTDLNIQNLNYFVQLFIQGNLWCSKFKSKKLLHFSPYIL